MTITVSKDIQKKLDQYGAKIVFKTGWFWTALHYLVLIFTFGGNRRFKDGFITTLGPIIGVPESWDGQRLTEGSRYEATILHELVHVSQFKWWGLGSAWLGILPMAVWYLLFPLPVFFCWGRWQSERWAYLVNCRYAKNFGDISLTMEIERVVGNMTSGAYGWTLPPFEFVKSYIRRWLRTHI